MKILLDENMPHQLKLSLSNHDVSHVEDEGWRSIKNGELLRLMIASGFELLITRDGQIKYQQNFRRHSIPVFILKARELNAVTIPRFASIINKLLKGRLKPGPHELTLN